MPNGELAMRLSSSDPTMLIARRMICQGDVSRRITSDSEIGSTSGFCSDGSDPAGLDRITWDSAKVRMILGSRDCSASSASRLVKMMPIAGRSSTASASRRAARLRATVVATGRRRYRRRNRLGRSDLKFADGLFGAGRRRRPACRQACSSSVAASTMAVLLNHSHTGSSDDRRNGPGAARRHRSGRG